MVGNDVAISYLLSIPCFDVECVRTGRKVSRTSGYLYHDAHIIRLSAALQGENEEAIEPLPKRTPKRYIVEVDDCMPECCMIPAVSSNENFRWLKCRCSIRCVVEHKYFEWFILFTVIFSSLVLVRKS